MAKIVRAFQKIFCGDVSGTNNVSQFGSLKAGTPVYSPDPDTIQALAAFKQGWAQALVDNGAPTLQDWNALEYLITRQLAYVFQAGIAEWNTATTYYAGSLVTNGAGVIYRSLADDNTGNALSDSTKWVYSRALAQAGLIQTWGGATPPSGSLLCDGSTYLQAAYPDLYTNIGATWATCTNPLTGSAYSAPASNYFRVPDLRGAFLRGVGGANADGVTTTLAGYQADATGRNGLGASASTSVGSSSFLATTGGPGSIAHTHVYGVYSGGSGNYPMAGSNGGNDLSRDTSDPHGGSALASHTHTVSGTVPAPSASTSVTLSGDAETRPQNVGVVYIIKAWNDVF